MAASLSSPDLLAAAPAALDEHAPRLEAIVLAHHDFLWRAIRRLGVPSADVDDAVQNVFVTASRKLAEVERGRERAYLFGVAVRIAANSRRAETRRRRVFTEDEKAAELARAPEASEATLETRELLDLALEPLPIEIRAVFILAELEEMTAPEIATLLSVPVGTVASRLRRGRELFSERARELRAAIDGVVDPPGRRSR